MDSTLNTLYATDFNGVKTRLYVIMKQYLASCYLANARQAKKWGDIYTIYLYISPLFRLSCFRKIARRKILMKQRQDFML